MTMIFTILNFLLLMVLLAIPLWLYKSPKRRMLCFYAYMTHSVSCRKFYCLILLQLAILFHFTYFSMGMKEYGLMVSTLLVIYLFSTARTERLLKRLRNSRRNLYTLFLVTLITLFIPHLFTLGATLGYVILAACFYPSHRMESYMVSHSAFPQDEDSKRDLISAYYA